VVRRRSTTKFGRLSAASVEDELKKAHLAIVRGEVTGKKGWLVRVHPRVSREDTLGSLRCGTGEQLQKALHEFSHGKSVASSCTGTEGRGMG